MKMTLLAKADKLELKRLEEDTKALCSYADLKDLYHKVVP